METCVICSETHETKDCPSIPGLKAVFQEDPSTLESLCFIARRPWQGQQNQGFNNSMNSQSQPNWNPWQQPWPQTQNAFQAWLQSMQNPYGRFAQFYQYPPSFQNQQAPQFPNQGQQLSLPYPQQQQPPPQNQNSQLSQQKSNQLPSQPLPNPNNRNPQNAYMMEGQPFPTYMVVPLNEVQLRSGRILDQPSTSIQPPSISEEESLKVNKGSEVSLPNPNLQEKESTPIVEQPSSSATPPFPERLQIDKGVEKQIWLPDYSFLDELKNVCIKIPLLQAIKEIPILAKTIKELSLKKT